jgi:hypothetical protein
MTEEDVEMMSKSMFGVELSALDKTQASIFIEKLVQTGEPATHPKIQQAIDSREANWIAAMEGAATMAELSKHANAALAEQAMTDNVRSTFNRMRDKLQERQLVTS